MSRDRKKETFNHSPFTSLKGLSVSGKAKERPAQPPAQPPPVSDEAADRDLFAREMVWQGVRPLEESVAGVASQHPSVPDTVADDAAEFLAAVGRLDQPFRDDLPSADAVPRARPRRMRQFERGAIEPAGELDLHGLARDEAVARTRTFLGHASRQGWAAVIIVTGRGLRSAEGPVLRQAVEQLLREAGNLVLEWGEAPRRFGGTGALVVFPRGGKPGK